MTESNPYQSPEAELATAQDQSVGELNFFTAKGRIGRMRYIAWTVGLMLIMQIAGFLIGLAAGLGGADQEGATALITIIAAIPSLLFGIFWASQRAHDFNASGWLAILVFLPLVNLIFWFIPGKAAANDYGPPPPANSVGVKILFWLMMVFLVLGGLGAFFALFSG